MNAASRPVQILEKLFWYYLFVNPFLDIVSGLYIYYIRGVQILDVKTISTLGVTPSLVVRMVMLVVFAVYVLLARDRNSVAAAVPIALAVVLSIVSEYRLTGGAQVFLDLQYAARFCFNLVLLMVYTRVFARRFGTDGTELLRKLDWLVAFTLAALSISILIPAAAGVGYSAYADRWGYRGNRGFFYAGNDITAVLAALLPILVARLMRMDRKAQRGRTVFFAIASGLAANALLIIGSKTAFIAEAATYALLLVCAVVALCRKDWRTALGYVWGLGAMLAIFFLLLALDHELWGNILESLGITRRLMEEEGAETALFSGRLVKFAKQFAEYRAGGVFVWLFGMGRGSQAEILEMDVFEVWLYYGVFGAVAFLWLYAKAAVEFFKGIARKKPFDAMSLALLAAVGMCAGYLIAAGHVLFSVTSGFYFIFAIVYSRVYFAAEAADVALWRDDSKLFFKK